MIEDAQGLDDVGHGDSPVSDEQQILTVLPVGRRGEVVRAEVDAGRRLVEVDDDELVVHARAPAAYRLRLEGLRHVLAEGGWHHGRDVAVGLLQIEAADLAVGDTVDEQIVILHHALDRGPDGSGRLEEEGQRIEEAGRRLVLDVACHLRQERILRAVGGEARAGIDAGEAEVRPLRRGRPGEGSRVVVAPVGLERRDEDGHRAVAAKDHRIVGLHEEPPPGKIGGAAHDGPPGRAVHDDVLLCCSLPMCCRFTCFAPADATRR